MTTYWVLYACFTEGVSEKWQIPYRLPFLNNRSPIFLPNLAYHKKANFKKSMRRYKYFFYLY